MMPDLNLYRREIMGINMERIVRVGDGRKEVFIREECERKVGEWTTRRAMSVERLGVLPHTEGGMKHF